MAQPKSYRSVPLLSEKKIFLKLFILCASSKCWVFYIEERHNELKILQTSHGPIFPWVLSGSLSPSSSSLLHLSPFPFSDWSLVVNLVGKRARPSKRETEYNAPCLPVHTRAGARLDSKNGGMVKGRERWKREEGRGGSPNAKLNIHLVCPSGVHCTVGGSFCPGPIFQIALAASLTPPLTEN